MQRGQFVRRQAMQVPELCVADKLAGIIYILEYLSIRSKQNEYSGNKQND